MKPRRQSLYLQLFGLFGLTFLLVAAIVIGTLVRNANNGGTSILAANVQHYAVLLAHELGTPPDPQLLRRLENRLDLKISVWGPGEPRIHEPAPRWAHHFEASIDGWTYGFTPHRTLTGEDAEGLLWLALFLFVVLLGSWLVLRRILAPLKRLSEAAAGFGVDDWSARLEVRGSTELAELAQTFNAMADRVGAHWESQRTLLAAVSHELRTPLTRMRVAIELVQQPSLREGLIADVLRLDRMTAILLERERLTLRPDLLDRSSVKWRQWLGDEIQAFKASGMKVSFEGPEVELELDQPRMALVVSNLMENIRRYAPDSEAQWRWTSDGTALRCTLADNGPGLSPAALAHWGEPFTGAHDPARPVRESGFGLGSALIKTIVAAHGGQVFVESLPGRGLAVTFTLPQSAASSST